MKKTFPFGVISLAAALSLQAEEVALETIDVEETVDITIVKDVAGEEVRSADLADALYKQDPDIQLIRRSGIANDIILRGMRKDDINVLIDGGKIYGGCPNRMDPPISHVLSSNVEKIVVKEGPYDVENFGTLSGLVEVETLAPEQGFHGEGNLNVGSWGYRKIGVQASGGNDGIRVMVGASTESSDQYEDGDGKTVAEQVDDFAAANPGNSKIAGAVYKPEYHDMEAYKKDSAMVKLFVDVTENQQLKLSYTVNRSENVLYPNTPMDALKDDSDLFNAKYTITGTGELSKKLEIEFYNSWVDHPMGTYYRIASDGNTGTVENVMSSRIYGGRVKNSMNLFDGTLVYGIDASKRRWDGYYMRNDGDYWRSSINDAVTKNGALFVEYEKRIGDLELQTGMRYDDTSVENDDSNLSGRDYNGVGLFLFGTYRLDEGFRYFVGIGKSSRVPDGKELYFQDKLTGDYLGNPNLDRTVNYEVDAGIEKAFEMSAIKGKVFYSRLKDYIAYNATAKKYENVDAKIYGFSVGGTCMFTEMFYADYGIAYQRGKKDHPLTGQNDTDMPNIPPLKGNVALSYDVDETFTTRISMVAASRWKDVDYENGEQELPGYAIFNFKLRKDVTRNFEVTAGIDNILDHTYAITNTYADMTLVTGIDDDPMLLNEPGRYYYCNLTYHF